MHLFTQESGSVHTEFVELYLNDCTKWVEICFDQLNSDNTGEVGLMPGCVVEQAHFLPLKLGNITLLSSFHDRAGLGNIKAEAGLSHFSAAEAPTRRGDVFCTAVDTIVRDVVLSCCLVVILHVCCCGVR